MQARDVAQDNAPASPAIARGDIPNAAVPAPSVASRTDATELPEHGPASPHKSSSSSTPFPAEDARKTPESADPAQAINAGLWEAIEELKSAKFGLEAKLRMAERRAKDLEKTLERTAVEAAEDAGSPTASVGPGVEACNSAPEARKPAAVSKSASPAAPARAWSTPPPPPHKEVATATALAVAERSEREVFEAERQALLEKMEELKVQAQAAADSAEAAVAAQRRAESAAEDAAAAAVAADEAEEAKKRVAAENEALRKERSSLKDQLEVFERLMDTEAHEASGVEDGDAGKTSLGDKVKSFHSQLALEAVGLRKEISSLKKKKWVLKSVLATGGESERRAIEAEVAELRRKTGRVAQTDGDAAESVKPG